MFFNLMLELEKTHDCVYETDERDRDKRQSKDAVCIRLKRRGKCIEMYIQHMKSLRITNPICISNLILNA